jgi:fatty acid desaturase
MNDPGSIIDAGREAGSAGHTTTRPQLRAMAGRAAPVCRAKAGVAQGSHLRVVPKEARAELLRLRTRDNWHNVYYLAGDWTTIAVAIALSIVIGHPAVYALSAVVIGSRQRALMNLVHEGSHRKLFRTRALNDWAAKLFAAFPLMTSVSAYVCAHCRHHASLWDADNDPKTIRYAELDLVAPRDDRTFWWRHLIRPLALYHAPYNIASSLSWRGEPRSERVQRVAFWVTALAAVSFLGIWQELLLYWMIPYCTTFQVIRYWTEMAEHAGLPSDDPWLATRNWDGSWLARYLLAPHRDDLYHLVHHLFPAIPHYRLGEAHRLLLAVPEYANAHQCDGFFRARSAHAPSVLQDIRRPQQPSALHRPAAAADA